MDSATLSELRPTLYSRGPEHINSKRFSTEATDTGVLGDAECNEPSPFTWSVVL